VIEGATLPDGSVATWWYVSYDTVDAELFKRAVTGI